jgi:uncharacterized protein with HEPN domain
MTEEGSKYLSDILYSIELIESFISDISTYSDYLSDKKTQSAVERHLGIIGEAVHKFDKLFPDEGIEHAGKIIGLRNRLVHSYDSVDSSIIWVIIKNNLAPLKEEVIQRLK